MRNINVLNDYFMRYMFAKEGHEHILLNLINAVRTDYDQEPFEEVKVLNTFNLKKTISDKQSIVDVMAVTKKGLEKGIEQGNIYSKKFKKIGYRCKSYQ